MNAETLERNKRNVLAIYDLMFAFESQHHLHRWSLRFFLATGHRSAICEFPCRHAQR